MRRLLPLPFLFLVFCGPAHAQTVCPTVKTNPTEVIPEAVRPKPGFLTSFTDSAYQTCFSRVTDDAAMPSNGHNQVPLYSQLQAWNADQTKIYLATGLILNYPSMTTFGNVATGGRNFRWSPIYPDTGYYSINNVGGSGAEHPKFQAICVTNGTIVTKHRFNEYLALETSNEWEDLSRDGRYVVLEGYKHCSATRCPVSSGQTPDTMHVTCSVTAGSASIRPTGGGKFDSLEVGAAIYGNGIQTHTRIQSIDRGTQTITLDKAATSGSSSAVLIFTNSEAFCFDVIAGRKVGNPIPGWGWFTGWNNGLADMLMSPSGKYILLHWNVGGIVAYDTTGAQVGQVTSGHGHYDLAMDTDGSEWAVEFTTGSPVGESGAYIAKARIPDGITASQAGDWTAFVNLTPWNDYIGGGHISGRALGKGFVVASADKPYPGAATGFGSRVAYSNEIVKIYLDSTIASPHIERLADSRSDEYTVNQDSTCPLGSYWAQPHATVSPDGKHVLWGSSWHSSGPSCSAESYLMDLGSGFGSDTIPPAPTRDLRAR